MGLRKLILLLTGIALVASALAISFVNPVAAGFFLVVGALAFLSSFVTWRELKSFSISPAAFSAEFREQIDRAEEILSSLKEVENRISYVLTEQMLNKGGHRYMGGFGEEAEFNIIKTLAAGDASTRSDLVEANIKVLKTRLGIRLLYAVIGARSDQKHAPNTVGFLVANEYKTLPTTDQLREFSKADGVDLAEVNHVLSAYDAFTARGEYPSEGVVQSLYELSTRREPWKK
ncbi:hypothetical protein [Pararhizobium sp. A13]|uniref:hypothetical protein n=1 Tax=Pararhizobium sp. A13 TaxID=3133975 RepID=UPI0032444D46